MTPDETALREELAVAREARDANYAALLACALELREALESLTVVQAILACALELREALEPKAAGQHHQALALAVERMARGLAALKAFDALTGVSAARVAGKGGGK